MQLKGVEKHIERQSDHCLLLGLPCGLDPPDIDKQALALQNIISYLLKKQAAGIINVYTEQVRISLILPLLLQIMFGVCM